MTPRATARPCSYLVATGVALLACAFLAGCLKGTTGLLRPIAPNVENTLTNTLAAVHFSVAPALPQPYSAATELGAGVILAAMAAWQTFTHRRLASVSKILNGSQKAPIK